MTTALEKLEEIQRELEKLEHRFNQLEGAKHVPRDPTDKRIPSILTQCAPNCPACALESEIAGRRSELGDLQRTALVENAQDDFRRRELRRAKSRKPRSRSPSLTMRGIKALLREFPEVTAAGLISLLDGKRRTYDDDDVEISLVGDDLAIRDLQTEQTKTVRKPHLRTYLRRARNS